MSFKRLALRAESLLKRGEYNDALRIYVSAFFSAENMLQMGDAFRGCAQCHLMLGEYERSQELSQKGGRFYEIYYE